MSVSIKDVEKIAELAKLRFGGDELERLRGDMNRILGYIDSLNELDLEKVQPLENINDIENVEREDIPNDCITNEEALKNAPAKTGKYFRVPKVIDK